MFRLAMAVSVGCLLALVGYVIGSALGDGNVTWARVSATIGFAIGCAIGSAVGSMASRVDDRGSSR